MSRKNRSKFIAFRLKNNQICKAVFVQFDERDTPATTPTASPSPSPATTTGTAWTPASPAPRRRAWSQGSPGGAGASTQQPPGSQRPAEASRNQGRASARGRKAKPAPSRGGEDARPAGERQPYPAQGTGNACTQGSQHSNQGQQEDRGRPSRPQPMQSPSQSDSRASAAQEMEGRGQRDGREGKEERPENDSKRAPPSLHPRQSQRPGAPAILPAVPAYTDRGQPRRAPENRGINSAFVEYAELPLTNAAHAIPGEARQGGYFTF